MEKNKKTTSKSVDIKTSTNNLFLNIAIFVLLTLIVFMMYSIYLKLTNSKKENDLLYDDKSVSEIIQVEVLNGCGVGGIADRFTDFLRNNKFDVVRMGNYIRFDLDETIIIDRTGNKANALAVANALGIKKENVIQQLNGEYFLDVSIVIGRDYYTLKPLK